MYIIFDLHDDVDGDGGNSEWEAVMAYRIPSAISISYKNSPFSFAFDAIDIKRCRLLNYFAFFDCFFFSIGFSLTRLID